MRHKNREILVIFFLFVLLTVGIVACAAEDRREEVQHIKGQQEEQLYSEEQQKEVQSIEKEGSDGDRIQGLPLDEESTEDEESIVSTESVILEYGTEQITDEELIHQRAAVILNQMTLEEKVAQMFFVTPELLTGEETVTNTGDPLKTALDQYPVGGLVYFAKNLQTPEQTKSMLQGVQDHMLQTRSLPIFLGVDEEGGRVLRIGSNSSFGVERIDAMGVLAAHQDADVIHAAASTIGAYLSDLGFNVDFAPDADVITNESNQVIGDRAFGSDPDIVADMAWAYTEGLHEYGILACYKHFPGHGGTVEDSHTGYAYSYKTIDELREVELVPFQSGCDNGIDLIMVSHVSTPNITGSDLPATLSKELVTDVLRGEMGYQGIVITDAMNMGAVSEHYSPEDAAVMAVEAGCDMLLMSDYFEPSYKAVFDAVSDGTIVESDIDDSVLRIIEAKLRLDS